MAVVVFTVIAVGTLLTPVVAAQASSAVVRGVVDVVLLLGGMVLWGPVLRHIPGASRPSPVGLAAYLFVQSVVPGFPSVIYVFARHPLYPAFAHAHAAIGLSAVGDQQLAGVVAKVATLPVLWSVAWRRPRPRGATRTRAPTPASSRGPRSNDSSSGPTGARGAGPGRRRPGRVPGHPAPGPRPGARRPRDDARDPRPPGSPGMRPGP